MCPVQLSDFGFSVCFETQTINKLKVYQNVKNNSSQNSQTNTVKPWKTVRELKR